MTPKRAVIDLVSAATHMQIPPTGRQRLRANAPAGWEAVVIESPTESRGEGTANISDELRDAIQTAEVYFGWGVSAELVEAAPMLKWVHSASAGVGGALNPALRERGIVFTNGAGIYAESMADTVLAGVMHFVRGLDIAVRQQAEACWDPAPWSDPSAHIREVDALTVVVIGTGGIGSAVGRRFSVLGARCLGVRRRPERGAPEGFETVVGFHEMETILPSGDVVIITAPLTAETRQFMDAGRLALLPDGAIVVNVSRGAVLDEAALLRELDSGRLRGAVLDVFATEPLPEADALWRHPRVLVTPHVSPVSPARQWNRTLQFFEQNWRSWVAGTPLDNIVDAEAGY